MASITKTSAGTWREEVRSKRVGHKPIRKVRTFDTRREAQAWADDVHKLVKQIQKNLRCLRIWPDSCWLISVRWPRKPLRTSTIL